MTGPHKIRRRRSLAGQCADGQGAFSRRDTGLAITVVDGCHEGGSERCIVAINDWPQLETIAGARQDWAAKLPSSAEHEIDSLGGYQFGRTDKIPFVFTVLRVEHHDDLAATNGIDGCMNGTKFLRHGKLLSLGKADLELYGLLIIEESHCLSFFQFGRFFSEYQSVCLSRFRIIAGRFVSPG